MGSFRDRYDEMKSKYGLADIDQSQGGNDRSSKFRNRYDEMKSKYGLADIDQVETKAEETQDVVKGKPILESVERDDGIFSMEAPKKKQTAPEETPAAVKPAFDRDQWLQDYAKEAERIFTPDQSYQEQKAREEYIKNQEDLRRNQEVTAKNLATLESWPEEDRQMLIQYALNDHKGRSVFERSSTSATRAATALVELQKKYDRDTIERLAESYQRYQNEIATKTMQEESVKEVQGKPGAAIVHSALTLPATLAGTVTAPLDYLGQALGRTGQYSTLDPNARGNLPNVYSSSVRQQVASDIAGDGKSVGRKAASYLYQGGMSALDTGARLLASGGNPTVAATLAGLGSFGQTVSQASQQGASPTEAMLYGTAAAGIEALTEKLPLDELAKTAKGGWNGLKPAIISALKQAGVEATEEEISLIGTTLVEMAILQEKASTNQRIQQLVAEEGMSVAEANNQVMYELLGEAMDTAVVSAISGGLSSAGGSVVAYMGRDTGGTHAAQEGAEAAQRQETTVAEVTADTATDQQQTQAEEPQSNVQKAVQEFRDTGKVSNRMAEVILNDAESVAALQKETGMELPDTASGRRNAVKDAVAQLSRNEDAKDLTSSTAEALLRKQEQPQEAKAEDPEENRRLAIEATRELVGLPKQETVENVDTSLNGQYNNNIKNGGNYYAGNQNDRTAGTGNSAQGMAGVRQGYGYGDRGGRQPSGVAANSGILRVSTHLRNAFTDRKHAGYELYDTTALPEAYERALAAGRDSDPVNGWCVTPKSAQELTEGSVRTFMNDNGTVGVGVAADGDIVAVFKNKNGGPKKALDTAMPAAIDMGGDRLDCYGEGLVKVYEDYGFIPVARVEFNPEYANPGWTPDKKTPYIYFMMHNGDSSAEVVEKMHSYPHKTKAELEALPTYGKDDYDAAMEYRNGLMDQRSADMDHGAVGAAERNFSGKQAFNELLSEKNAQPDRPGDVRPMEIPKKDAYGRRVSETAANLYGAEVTPDTMADTIQELIGIGALGFDTRSNDQSLKAAAASITKTGRKATEKQITNRVANGKLQDGDIEKALLLYSAYANKDDQASQDMAAELVVDLATMANMTGRNLQLFKLIRKLTPQGQLMATQKTVQRYVDRVNKKRGKNNQVSIVIPDSLEMEYLDAAKTSLDKRSSVSLAVAENIGSQMDEYVYDAAQWASEYAFNESVPAKNTLAEETGKKVADRLMKDAKKQNKSIEDILFQDIMRFASEKAKIEKAGSAQEKSTKNLETLRDYYRYRPFFQTAWNVARNRVEAEMQKMKADDPRIAKLEQFLATGDSEIGIENVSPVMRYDPGNPSSVVRKAAKEAAGKAGYRMENRSDRSANAVKDEIKDVLTQNVRSKQEAALRIAKIAVESLDMTTDSARGMAQDVVQAFYADLAERSSRKIEQMFGTSEKVQKAKKTLSQKLEELYNIGAFNNSMYRQAAFDSLFGEGSKVDIPDALMEEFVNAADKRKAQIEQAIYLSAASQIKATFAEKWNAWRYMCMLGNVKTNVRNIGGNIAQIPYTEAKRIIGAAFEKALPKEQRTKAVLGLSENDRALKEWAAADAKTETVNDALKYSAKLGDDLTSSKISDARRIFDKDVVEKARKLVSDIPAGADMFFKNIEYTKSLAGFVKARGYTYADIESGKVSEAVLNEGRAYAIQEAMKATFNDANAFSDFVSNLRYKGNNPAGKALNALGEGILPFRRTPANVAVRMVENSPANIARSVWNMATKVKNGDMSAATAIDQMAAGLTGTGAMMLGALLASGFAGFRLLGSDVDEDEKRLGHQKYSIEFSINGQEYSYTVDWAAPAAIPLFVGAKVYDLWQSRNEDTGLSAFTSAVYAGINMLEPMLSLACLSSLQDAIESVKYAEEGTALYALVANAATSYFTQGIPSLLRQASQAIPENKQQTFANSADPLIRDLQKTVANIPFAGYAFKTDKVDEWGEKEDAGNVAARVFNTFFNPGTLKAIDNSDLEAEINRLNKAQPESITPPEASKKISYTDKNGKYHDGYRLTEEEYTKLRQVQGQTAYEILQKVISSSDYKALTDAQKANVFSHVYSYASERARVNAISDYGGFSKAWMMNIRGKEADTIIRKVVLGDISESMTAINKALDENWNTAEAAGNMETAWKAYSRLSRGAQAEIRKEAGESAAGKYIAAREAGVTNAEYVTVLKNVAGLKPQSGYKNVREIQQAQAVGKMSGLSNAEKEAMIRGYVSDGQDKNIDDMKDLFRDKNRSFSVNDYLTAWAISDKESGKGRKDRIIAEYRKRFNLDEGTAEELYKIFG